MENLMLILFVFAALVNCGPVPNNQSKEHIIATTQFPKLDGNALNFKIGTCPYRAFVEKVMVCETKFYLSFRTDKKTSCSERYAPLGKCHLDNVERCSKPVMSSEGLADVMNKYKTSMVVHKQTHCGEREYNIASFFRSLPFKDECPNGTVQKLNNCLQLWYRNFQKNPGDPKHCREYQESRQCMKRVIGRCSFDFSKSNWIFDDVKINPFCDKKQMAEMIA